MSKCKITGKVLVIHLGKEETRIVRMNGSEVQHRAAFITPSGAIEDGAIRNPEAVRELLKAALKAKEFRGVRQAVFVLNTSQVITSVATTPELPEARLEKLLQANMDMYFPIDIEEYHVVWQVVGPKTTENGTKELLVQLWAVPDGITQRYYSVANACGLSVAAIDYCGHSIATAVGASFAAAGKAKKKRGLNRELSFGKKHELESSSVAVEEQLAADTDLHVTLEKELLGMTFIQEGRVVLQRFVRCGGDPVYQFSELSMILEYYRTLEVGRGSDIRGIISSDYANDPAVCRELADMLGIPLRVLSGDIAPQMVMFVGAARTTIDFGTPALNRPGKVRRELQSQLWQYVLVLASGAVLVGVILLALSSQLVWDASVRGLEASLQMVSIQAQQSAGFADNYKNYASKYDSYSADWDTVYSSLQTYNDNLALALQELEDVLPEKTSVTALQIAPNGMNVQFACESKEEAAFLIMALRQLKYADLAAISNLGGGGGGAAESYGPDPETPPTEGSFDPATDGMVTVTFALSAQAETESSAIEELISSELTEEEIMGLAASLTPEEIKALETAYGVVPPTKFNTLSTLKAGKAPTFDQRRNALKLMFNSDPFVANRFVDLMMEDLYRDQSILMKLILWDLMDLDFDMSNPAGLQESMDDLLNILTRDDATLTATENLLCSETKIEGKEASVSELTYVHYLEVILEIREFERFSFLDVDALFTDLLEGGFDTGDELLDEKLNALISDKTWALLRSFNSQETVSEMITDYVTKGTSGEPVADELIEDYLQNGTTGNKTLDGRIETYLGGEEMASLAEELLEEYLTDGKTGNALLDEVIDGYFESGETKSKALTAQFNAAMSGSEMKALMTELLKGYLTKGATGNTMLDIKLGKYFAKGSSGSAVLDTLINSCISSGNLDALFEELVGKYLSDGTSKSPAVDTMIANYKDSGSCGNLYIDEIFSKLIPTVEDPLGGLTEEELAERIEKYLTEGSSGDENLNKKLSSYFSQGTSGNDTVNKAIVKYLGSAQAEQTFIQLTNEYLTDSSTGVNITDSMIGGFFANDSSGNKTVDEIIKKHIESGDADSVLEPRVEKFVDNGSSGIPQLDKKLTRYSVDGTTGSVKLDALLRAKLPQEENDPFAGMSAGQIKDMLDNYFANGTTGNGAVDIMLDQYMATGTTGNPAVDTIIKSYIATNESNDYLSDLLIKYFATGTTGRTALDKMIDGYILYGTTGNTALDIAITGTLGTGAVLEKGIVKMLDNYLAVGTTGNKVVDIAIENYLLKGTTGNENLDKALGKYMEERSEDFDNKINSMFADYLANGTTGYIVFDQLIDKYLEDGTTGNKIMDVIMEEYMKDRLSELFEKYLADGTSGIPAFDKMIENYLMRGTTGNPGYDRMISQYMKSDAVKGMLQDLVDKYKKDGSTGNNKLDALFFLYLMRGTTGNKELDALLKELGLNVGKDPVKPNDPSKPGGDNWEDIWEDLFGGGNSGGTPTGPVDTRITFTAVLLYDEDLIQAELIRKGLDYDGKIDKLEVED